MRHLRFIFFALLMLVSFKSHAADSLGKQPVKTSAKTDVQAQVAGADGATLGQVSANNTAQAAGGMWALPAIVQSALPTYSTNGNLVGLTVDASGRLYTTIDATVTVGTNIAKIAGAVPAATNALPSQLTDGAAFYVGAKTGQLPTALGQTTKAASLAVTLPSDIGTLAVSQGAPTGSSFNKATVVNIASAGTSAIVCKSAIAVSTPTKPLQYVITASAGVRCQLRYNDNGSFTQFTDVVVTPGYSTVVWTPPSGIVGLTTSATSTTQQYEANCTNFDSVATDVGCSVIYCSNASGC